MEIMWNRIPILVCVICICSAMVSSSESNGTGVDEGWGEMVGGQCRTRCQAPPTAVNHSPHTEYVYKYEGDLKTLVTAAEYVGTRYEADAHVQVINQCNFMLKLSNVKLWDLVASQDDVITPSASSMQFKRALEADNLNYVMEGGKLTSICPNKDQEVWVLNVKRAILSALQTRNDPSMTSMVESDVGGSCETVYSDLGGGKVRKVKDLANCRGRQATDVMLQGVSYQDNEGNQHIPLMRSMQICDQEVIDGIVKTSKCSEVHTYNPFPTSNQASSASVTITANLTFVSQSHISSLIPLTPERVRKSLTYDHEAGTFESVESFKEAQSLLEQMQRLDQSSGIDGNTAELFLLLIRQLEKFSLRQFQILLSDNSPPRTKTYLWDALPLVGTSEAMRRMEELYDEVDVDHQRAWMAALAFIKKPSLEALLKAESFLQKDFFTACLPFSTMYNNYISQPGSRKDAVEHIPRGFSLLLKRTYRDKDEEKKAFFALKALGNIAGLDEDVLERLYTLMKDERVSVEMKDERVTVEMKDERVTVEMKVHAMNALRRQECSKLDLEYLADTYLDKHLDSELRITAYLQRVRCLDDRFLIQVETGLNQEEVNQVGSFVWTHLSNLAASQSPHKEAVKRMVERIDLREFDLDKLKFSRSFEWSKFSTKYNLGGSVGSNLIWSEKSFVPRSANLNLTIDLFGSSINFLELGARVQGVEGLLEESLSGYPQKSSEDEGGGEVDPDQLSSSHDAKYGQKKDDSSLVTSVRVFGNEISMQRYTNLEQIIAEFSYFNLIVELSKEQTVDVIKNMKIFDASFTVPSLIGLPLKLHAEGAASLALKLEGKLDVTRLLATLPGFEVYGSLRPSASVVVKAEIGVDSKLIKSGLKLVNKLRSNTAIEGKVLFAGGNKFELDWSLPDERTDVISAESKLYFVNRRQEVEKMPSEAHINHTKCFAERLTLKVSGMHFCYQLSKPAVEGWSLSSIAPYLSRFYARKIDAGTKYHLEGGFIQSETDPTDQFYVHFDTPGSTIDRKISFLFELNRISTSVLLDVQTPWKSLRALAGYSFHPELFQMNAGLLIDQLIGYSFDGKVPIVRRPNGLVEYYPEVVLKMYGREDVSLNGKFILDDRRANLELALVNVEEDPVHIDGNIVYDVRNQRYELNCRILSNFIKVSTISNATQTSTESLKGWFVRSQSNYQVMGGPREILALDLKLHDFSSEYSKSYESDLSILSTQFPIITFSSKGQLEYARNSFKTKLDIGRNPSERLIFTQDGILDFNSEGHVIGGNIGLEAPYKDIKWLAAYKHKYTSGSFDANLTLLYDPERKVFASILYKNQHNPLLDFIVKARLDLPRGLRFYVQEKIQETSIQHYKQEFLATFDAGYVMSRAEVPGFYNVDDNVHNVGATVKFNNYPPLEINAALRPHWNNLKVKLGAVYEETTYGVEGNFKLENNDGYLMETDLKITYPNYQPKILLLAKRGIDGGMLINGSLEITDDLKYSTLCTLRSSLSSPQFLLSFLWPGNHATLTLVGSQEYTNGYTTSGTGKFTSSIEGLEEIGVELNYGKVRESVDSKIKLFWSSENFIEGNLNIDLEENGLTLEILTPFEESKVFKLSTITKIMNSFLDHNSTIMWNDKYIHMSVNGELKQPLSFLGGIQLKSSYPVLDSIAIKAVLDVADEIDSEFTITMPSGDKFSISTKFVHSINAKKSKGSLILEIPIFELPVQKLAWELDWDDRKYDGKVDIAFMRDSFTLISDGSSRIESNVEQMVNLNFKTESSRSFFDDIVVSLEHVEDRNTHSYNTKLNGHYRNVYQGHFYQNLKYLRSNFLSIALDGEVKTEQVHRFELNSDNRLINGVYQSKSQFYATNYGGGDMLGVFKFGGLYDVDANLKLTTLPYNDTLLELIFVNLNQDEAWTSQSIVTYRETKLWTSETRFADQEGSKKFDLELSTPLESLKLLKMKGIFENTNGHYKLNGLVEHNLLEDKIALDLDLNIKDPSLIAFKFNLTSPLEQINLLNVDIAYTHTVAENRHVISGLIEYNDQKSYISSIILMQSYYHFSAQTILELPGYNKNLELFGMFRLNDSGYQSEFWLQTPYEVLNKLGYKLDLTGNFRKFNEVLLVEYNNLRINEYVEFDMSTPHYFKFSRQINSSSDYIAPSLVYIEHTGPVNDFKTSAKYDLGYSTYSLDAEVNVIEDFLGKIVIKTPFEEYKDIKFDVNLLRENEQSSKIWKGDAKLQINEDTHYGEVSLIVSRENSVLLEVSFNSPVEFDLVFSYGGAWSRFNSGMRVSVNQHFVNGSLSFDAESFRTMNTIQGNLLVLTSFESFRKAEAILIHNGPASSFTTTLDIYLPLPSYEEFKVKLQYLGNQNQFNSVFSFNTPFSTLRQYDFTVDFSHKDLKYDLHSSMEMIGDNNYKLEATVVLPLYIADNIVKFKVTFEVPSSSGKLYKIDLQCRAIPWSIDASGEISTPYEVYYRIELKHRSARSNVETNAKVFVLDQSSPKMEFNVNGKIISIANFDLLFQVKTQMGFQVDYELAMSESEKFLSNLEMILPLEQLPWLQLNLGYSVASEALDLSLKTGFQLYFDKYSTELVLKFNDGLKIEYGFETPLEYYKKFHFGLTGLRNSELLEFGVETAAPFLPFSHFKANHLFKGNFRNFISRQLLYFSKDGNVVDVIMDSSYRQTRADDNQFNFDLTTSFAALKNIKFSHESIHTDSKGTLIVTHSGDKQVNFEYKVKNELEERIDRYLTLLASTNESYASIGVGYQQSGDRHEHEVVLKFTENAIKPDFLYKFECNSHTRDAAKIDNGVVTVSSRVVNFKSGFNRVWQIDHFNSEFYIECLNSHEKLVIKTSYIDSEYTITLEHPLIPRDTSIRTKYNLTHSSVYGQMVVKLGENEFLLLLSYDHTIPSQHLITIKLSYPNVPLNVILTGLYKEDYRTNTLELACSSDSQQFAYSHKYDKLHQNFDLKLLSPYSSSSLAIVNPQRIPDYDEYIYDIVFTFDDIYFKQTFSFNVDRRFAELRFHLNERDCYQLYGLLDGFTDFKLALNYFSEEGVRNDVNVSLLLDAENYLKFKSFFRPNLTEKLWTRLQESQDEIETSYNERELKMKRWVEGMSEEMAKKNENMGRVMTPYWNALEKLKEMLGRIGERWDEEVKRVYEENAFYVDEIDKALAALKEMLREFFSDLLNSLYLLSLQEKFQGIKEGFYRGLESLQRKIEEWRIAQRESFAILYRHLQTIQQNIKDYLDKLLANPWLMEFMNTYSGISIQELLEKFLGLFDGLLMNSRFNAWVDALLGAMLNISTYLEDLISNEGLRNFQSYINQQLSLPSVKQKLMVMKVNFLRLDEWGWVVFDPLEGVYDYQLYIPFKLPSLAFLLDIILYDYLDSIWQLLAVMIERFGDIVEYLAVMDEPDAFYSVLPFQFSASVTGLHHYRTFDGRIFSFAGNCMYLLARDFQEKTFSLYVVYGRKMNSGNSEPMLYKYFVVVSDGRKIEFHMDGRVTVNGQKSELPIHLNHTNIVRSGHNEVKLTSDRGYSFKYDIFHDIFSLKVSGWFHGRIRGLLGWNDNEPANDLLLQNGSYVGLIEDYKVEDATESWVLDPTNQCTSSNLAPTTHLHHPTSLAHILCQDLFNNTSSSNPLQGCYEALSPTNYIQMCLNDMSPEPRPQMACAVATTYHHDCKQLHVYVRLPSYCVLCQGSQSTPVYSEGETLRIERSQSLADVVFVVREGVCQSSLHTYFSQLVNQLNRTFTRKGINARYAFVTYGLNEGTPQIRTVDEAVFTTSEKMAQVQINTSTPLSLEASHTTPSPTIVNGMQAIEFASKMSFRAGANKAIISIPCTPCNASSKWDFLDLFKSLQLHDIAVHVIHPSEFEVSTSTPSRTALVFGINHERAFLHSQTDRMERLMKAHVKAPVDQCASLSRASEGSVFSIVQYINSAPVIQREFLESLSSAVSEKRFHCQECVCVSDSVAAGRNMCSRCHSYEFESNQTER